MQKVITVTAHTQLAESVTFTETEYPLINQHLAEGWEIDDMEVVELDASQHHYAIVFVLEKEENDEKEEEEDVDEENWPIDTTDRESFSIFLGVDNETEAAMKDAGLKDWAMVAAIDARQLHHYFLKAGIVPKEVEPAAIIEQARLADAGDWKGFFNYRDSLIQDSDAD